MPVPRRYWVAGIAGAVLAHALVFALVLWPSPERGARGAGVGGIEVSLGAAGGAPGSITTNAVDTLEAEIVRPVEAAAETAPTQAETKRVETADAPPLAEPEEVAAQTVNDGTPETAREARPESVDVQPLEKKAPVVAAEKAESTPAVKEEEPQTAATVAPESAEPADTPKTTQAKTSAASVAGAAGKSGTENARGAGTGADSSGGGRPGASPDYLARLRAWLEQHKRYPRRARLRQLEGTALLRFVIDRRGRVLEYDIRESSGYDILDEAVVAMIERAQPMPEMPADMKQSRLELVLPVRFLVL